MRLASSRQHAAVPGQRMSAARANLPTQLPCPEPSGGHDAARVHKLLTGREDLDMLFCQCNVMHRRDVVCGGGAAMFGAIIATVMGGTKPVKAEAISNSNSVPELDGVAVRVVVDSYQFAVAPSRKACRC